MPVLLKPPLGIYCLAFGFVVLPCFDLDFAVLDEDCPEEADFLEVCLVPEFFDDAVLPDLDTSPGVSIRH